MTVDDAVEELREMGVELPEPPTNGGKIASMRAPWTAEEWFESVSKEGEWLGPCCATISAMRDILLSAMREGGWLRTQDLARFVELADSHDGFADDLRKQPPENPLGRLVRAWDVAAPHASFQGESSRPVDLKNVNDAVWVISNAATSLSWATLTMSENPDAEAKFHSQVGRARALARVIPALKTLSDRIRELDLGPVRGFAIVDGTTGEPFQTVGGIAVYATREKCEQVLASWRQGDTHFGKREASVSIRPCRASMDEGLVLEEG